MNLQHKLLAAALLPLAFAACRSGETGPGAAGAGTSATLEVAPGIEGGDLDGVALKLSGCKGKVIFLDFWGDW